MPNTLDAFISNFTGTKKTTFEVSGIRLQDNQSGDRISFYVIASGLLARLVGQNTHKIGSVMLVQDNSLDEGWLWANGQAVSQTTYAELYAKLGGRYGIPQPGQFNLPNIATPVTHMAYQIYAGK